MFEVLEPNPNMPSRPDVGNLLGHREQSSQSSAVFESVDLSELEPTSSELTPVSSTPCSSGSMIDSDMPYGHSISSLSIPSKNIQEDNFPSQVEVVVVRRFKSNQSDLPIEELQTTENYSEERHSKFVLVSVK